MGLRYTRFGTNWAAQVESITPKWKNSFEMQPQRCSVNSLLSFSQRNGGVRTSVQAEFLKNVFLDFIINF